MCGSGTGILRRDDDDDGDDDDDELPEPLAAGWFSGNNFRSALLTWAKTRRCLQTNHDDYDELIKPRLRASS